MTPWQEVIPWGYHHKTQSPICIATIFPSAIIEPEYYLKPLSGTQRLLRPVSNYLKGNHDIEFPVNTYSVRLQQVIRETQLSALQYVYTNEALSDAGKPEADAWK